MRASTQILTPRMHGLLQRIQRAQRTPLHALTPAQARSSYEAAAEILDLPRAPLRRVVDFHLPAADGTPLPARLYSDAVTPVPVMLYLHGGGFVIGSLDTHDSLCRQLALRSGAAVVALDYRLAPEHRFPTAVDDAWAALHGCTPMRRRWAWTAPAWPSAATAPAARWQRCARCVPATTACRWRCSC